MKRMFNLIALMPARADPELKGQSACFIPSHI
jgi:hypothetical protein